MLLTINKHKKLEFSKYHKKSDADKERIKTMILNSDINFSDIGWVKKSTIQFGFDPFNFIRKYMPELYEKCNKRHKKQNIETEKNNRNRKKYLEDKKNEYFKKNKPIIEKILVSDIDFSKKGWVKKFLKLLKYLKIKVVNG